MYYNFDNFSREVFNRLQTFSFPIISNIPKIPGLTPSPVIAILMGLITSPIDIPFVFAKDERIGFRKRRKPIEDVIHSEKFGDPLITPV